MKPRFCPNCAAGLKEEPVGIGDTTYHVECTACKWSGDVSTLTQFYDQELVGSRGE